MDSHNADIFRENLEQYSDGKLEIAAESVPILHNVKKAIELSRPTPDIFFIAMNHISFDTPDHENELLETLSSLKVANNNIRLAVQADIDPSDPLLKKIALLQITDIFPGSRHNPEVFDMEKVAIQLSKPTSVMNVYKYFNLSKDDSYLNDGLGLEKSYFDNNGSADERKLKKLVKTLIAQNNMVKKKTGVNTVPRKDYDELVNMLGKVESSGLSTDSMKETVRKILKVNQETTKESKEVANINGELNNSIVELMKNTNDEEVTKLKQEAEKLKRALKSERERSKKIHKNNDANGRAAPQSVVSKKRNSGIKKLLIFLAAISMLAMIGGPTLIRLLRPSNYETEQPARPAFNSLIKARNYEKAAKYYPKKAVEAENAMLADSELTDKADMAKKILAFSSNDVIKFDNDYFEQKYEEATDIYKNSAESDLTNLTKERRVMAAYCLMKTGNIVDAKSTAKPLNNANLNKRIEVFEKFYNANKILSNKIQNDHLSQKEEKRAREQMRKNQEAMDKL